MPKFKLIIFTAKTWIVIVFSVELLKQRSWLEVDPQISALVEKTLHQKIVRFAENLDFFGGLFFKNKFFHLFPETQF